jgi:hypothetical protein
MTEQEARAKSRDKAQQIKDLAKSLQVSMVAQQIITNQNVIENVVGFIDHEHYQIDPIPSVVREPEKDDTDTTLQK